MNYIATSSIWRQDHNGFTHQNPILINTLMAKYVDFVHVYFPSDVNTLLVVMEKCLKSKNQVNLIISGKTELPQWLSLSQARQHLEQGIGQWSFACNCKANEDPDVVLASSGDYQTLETLAAIDILRKTCPALKIRYINVIEYGCNFLGRCRLSEQELNDYFTADKPVIMNFHGYVEAIRQIELPVNLLQRMRLLGYIEKGTTTTPFDMQIKNRTSRFHIAIEALKAGAAHNPAVAKISTSLIEEMEKKIAYHKEYIKKEGDDMQEIKNWKWTIK
jgi:xylulose-5-phosphate/fructose-6-phosphate phosphoketolase